MKSKSTESLTRKAQGRATAGRWVVLVPALFVVVGLLFLGFLIPTVRTAISARSWPATECMILESRLEESSDSEGTTYRIFARYSYAFDGREYTSERYQAGTWYSSGYKSKRAVVDALRPGTQTICYVNPANPAEAVINREIGWEALILILPVGFILLGSIGVVAALRQRRRQSAAASSAVRPIHSHAPMARGRPAQAVAPAGEVELRPKDNRWLGVIFLTGFAALWNGLIWTLMVPEAWGDWGDGLEGGFDLCFAAFSIPFIAAGVAMVGIDVYLILRLFNPRAVVTVSSRSVPLGGSMQVRWRLTGRVDRIRRLRIALEGREEATYRRGTNTTTDRNVFFAHDFVDTIRSHEIPMGQTTVSVPAESMHSLGMANNKIVWSVVVRGEIARWPDVDERFDIEVLPVAEIEATTGG